MLRIPNPGSDVAYFIRIFRELYEDLSHLPQFSLDDMGKAMSIRKSVASQGAIGAEALKRSTRPDRSRDPIFNQVKMYSELFRVLGWLQLASNAQTFTFSPLGREIAVSPDPTLLVRECLLGIAYPNELVGVLTAASVRIFATVLYTMERLGGTITRDEIISGPMHLKDDREKAYFDSMVDFLDGCRQRPDRLRAFFAKLETEQGIQQTTRENYTRFVIGALRWSGWGTKVDQHFQLTELGRAQVAALRKLIDLRLADVAKVASPDALLRIAYGDMLGRAGLASLVPGFNRVDDEAAIPKSMKPGLTLFSPFQQLSAAKLVQGFGLSLKAAGKRTSHEVPSSAAPELSARHRVTEIRTRAAGAITLDRAGAQELARELAGALAAHGGNIDAAVEKLATRHVTAKQAAFYDLVANLFCILGYPCAASRAGVNYLRADAMIEDSAESMPIEIKSPTEELQLSVKAVRQALENKIVLLARKGFPTKRETTSLAVGYEAPNERADVRDLIDDIHKAFGINIAVLDLRTLLRLALSAVERRTKLEVIDLRRSRGILRAT